MSAQFDQVKVLEQCQISLPLNSVPTTSFPLTFLDITWINCSPIQRVFLYQVPFSAAQFTKEILPQLKNSLSVALQRFFPFCGNFVCPPQPSEPYILYNDGDSVPLLVSLCTGAFSDFLTDGPRDAMEIHPLVPPTPPTRVLEDTLLELTPLLAIQLTLFPNSGLCIGITFRHIVSDGTSFNHFVKTWASIFKANCDISSVSISLPVLDKEVIKDPDGVKNVLLDQWRASGSPTGNETAALMEDTVRATFTLSRMEIDQLKKLVTTKSGKGTETAPNSHISSFVVTCAFIWICFIKSLDMITSDDSSKSEKLCHLGILADCRNKYGMGIPTTFFGNCLSVRYISIPRSKFTQEDSITTVAEAISHSVQSFKHGVFDGIKTQPLHPAEVSGSGENVLTVAGSPKLAAYETDFGWGRPSKTEVVHIDITGSISLSESRNENGGIEVGICRSRHHMNLFASFFRQGLNQFLVKETKCILLK